MGTSRAPMPGQVGTNEPRMRLYPEYISMGANSVHGGTNTTTVCPLARDSAVGHMGVCLHAIRKVEWPHMSKSNGKAEPQPLPHEDPCYRPNKAGEISGHNAEFIRQAIRKGVLKGVRLGRRSVGVRASELARWMAAMEAGDPAAFMPSRAPT